MLRNPVDRKRTNDAAIGKLSLDKISETPEEGAMDALPLVLNKQQLELMHNGLNQAIDQLQQQNPSQFSNQQEQNLNTYGTDDLDEALGRLTAIDDQLQSEISQWDSDANSAKPVAIDLDSYQVTLLRSSLVDQAGHAEQSLLDDILQQLPEDSPMEDAD